MLTPKIVIIGGGRMFGPFDDQEIAQAWLDAPHDAGKNPELYSVTSRESGTAERAHECGHRLTGIDEASHSTTTRRSSAA